MCEKDDDRCGVDRCLVYDDESIANATCCVVPHIAFYTLLVDEAAILYYNPL
jgi:hypothetical protein